MSQSLLFAVILSVPLSLILFFYQRGLVPIYGSVPTNAYLDHVVLSELVLILSSSAISRSPWKGPKTWLFGALVFLLAPNALYWVPVLTARKRDPVLGPIVTHLTTLTFLVGVVISAVIYLSVCSHLRRFRALTRSVFKSGILDTVLPATVCYVLALATRNHWKRVSFLNSVSESDLVRASYFHTFLPTMPSS
jgi:hypothetical protein